jgi:hypothetical protein
MDLYFKEENKMFAEKAVNKRDECLRTTGTGIETMAGGGVGGYVRIGARLIKAQSACCDNFFAKHLISAYSGALLFSILGTTFKYVREAEREKIANPANSFSRVISSHRKEAIEFALSLFLLGGASFAVYMGLEELFRNLCHLDIIPAGIAAGFLGFAVFAVGHYLPALQMPWEKLINLIGVYFGFTLGNYAVEAISNSHLTNEAISKYVVEPLVPPLVGAAGSVVANLTFRGVANLMNKFGLCSSRQAPQIPVQYSSTEEEYQNLLDPS